MEKQMMETTDYTFKNLVLAASLVPFENYVGSLSSQMKTHILSPEQTRLALLEIYGVIPRKFHIVALLDMRSRNSLGLK